MPPQRFSPVCMVVILTVCGGSVRPAVGSPLDDGLRRLRSEDVLTADAAVEELIPLGSAAVDSLLPLLEDPARDVRAGAIRALGRIGDSRATAPLLRQLEASLAGTEPDTFADRYHRILLIRALGRMGESEAQSALRGVALTGDAFERAHAGISLFLIGEESGYDLVLKSLGDPSPAIRSLTAEGLAESRSRRSRELLLRAAADSEWVVRDAAFQSLSRWLGHEAVEQAFRAGAKDPSWYVRQTVEDVRRAASAAGN
ncbi:MAG: hypothetical protein CME07_03415 [Gemmatimonadetes bacterium]|nr:hypothetical protein [Gemmatimonadota bacterium]